MAYADDDIWGNGLASTSFLDRAFEEQQQQNQADATQKVTDWRQGNDGFLSGLSNYIPQHQLSSGWYSAGSMPAPSPDNPGPTQGPEDPNAWMNEGVGPTEPPQSRNFLGNVGHILGQAAAIPLGGGGGENAPYTSPGANYSGMQQAYNAANIDVPGYSGLARNTLRPAVESAVNAPFQAAGLDTDIPGQLASGFVPVGAADIGMAALPFAGKGAEAASAGLKGLGRTALETGLGQGSALPEEISAATRFRNPLEVNDISELPQTPGESIQHRHTLQGPANSQLEWREYPNGDAHIVNVNAGDVQGQGVGTRLLQRAIADIRAQNPDAMITADLNSEGGARLFARQPDAEFTDLHGRPMAPQEAAVAADNAEGPHVTLTGRGVAPQRELSMVGGGALTPEEIAKFQEQSAQLARELGQEPGVNPADAAAKSRNDQLLEEMGHPAGVKPEMPNINEAPTSSGLFNHPQQPVWEQNLPASGSDLASHVAQYDVNGHIVQADMHTPNGPIEVRMPDAPSVQGGDFRQIGQFINELARANPDKQILFDPLNYREGEGFNLPNKVSPETASPKLPASAGGGMEPPQEPPPVAHEPAFDENGNPLRNIDPETGRSLEHGPEWMEQPGSNWEDRQPLIKDKPFDEGWSGGRVLNELVALIRTPVRTATLGFHQLRIGSGMVTRQALEGNPDVFWQGLKDNLNVWRDPAAQTQIDERLSQLPHAEMWDNFRSADQTGRQYPKPIVDKVLDHIGIKGVYPLERSRQGMTSYLNTARRMSFEIDASALDKINAEPNMYKDLYDATNHATGIAGGRMGAVGSTLGYSPSAAIARVKMQLDALNPDSSGTYGPLGHNGLRPTLGAGARSVAFRNLIGSAIIVAAGDAASTQLGGSIGLPDWTKYGFNTATGKAIYDNTKEDWSAGIMPLDRTIAGMTKMLLTPGKSSWDDAVKLGASYLRGEGGPVIDQAVNLTTGYDAVGNPVTPKDLATLKAEAHIWAPFMAMNFYDALTTPGGRWPAAIPGLGAASIQTSQPKGAVNSDIPASLQKFVGGTAAPTSPAVPVPTPSAAPVQDWKKVLGIKGYSSGGTIETQPLSLNYMTFKDR